MNTKKLVSRLLLIFVAASLVVAVADVSGLRQKFLGSSPRSASNVTAADGRVELDAHRYAAIFYHAKHRCDTCRKIEESAHTALQPAIDADEILWEVSDYTSSENREAARSMDVMTSTVVLIERDNGEVVRFQNLDDVWLHTSDPEQMASFITESWKSFREHL